MQNLIARATANDLAFQSTRQEGSASECNGLAMPTLVHHVRVSLARCLCCFWMQFVWPAPGARDSSGAGDFRSWILTLMLDAARAFVSNLVLTNELCAANYTVHPHCLLLEWLWSCVERTRTPAGSSGSTTAATFRHSSCSASRRRCLHRP